MKFAVAFVVEVFAGSNILTSLGGYEPKLMFIERDTLLLFERNSPCICRLGICGGVLQQV